MLLDHSKGAPPLYYQIKEYLKNKIEEEDYLKGDILPSELELQQFFNVSRITVRQAINELVNEGYLSRTRGKGTKVIFNKIEEELNRIMSFTEEMRMRGLEPSTKNIEVTMVKPTKGIAKFLGTNEHEKVYKIERLRYISGKPMVLFITYLNPNLELSLDESEYTGSLYEYLNKSNNIVVAKAKEYFEAVASDNKISKYLEVEEKTPVLKRTRLSYDGDGNSLEYTICYYRADRYRYSVEIG